MSSLSEIEAEARVLWATGFKFGNLNSFERIVAAGLWGRDYGWSVAQSVASFQVVRDKLGLSPVAMFGLINEAGHRLEFEVERDAGGAVEAVIASGKRADNGAEDRCRFSMDDARAQGLTKNENYKSMPEAMLRKRAGASVARHLFADVLAGVVYVGDELEGIAEGAASAVSEEVAVPAAKSVADLVAAAVKVKRAVLKRAVVAELGGEVDRAAKVWRLAGAGVEEEWVEPGGVADVAQLLAELVEAGGDVEELEGRRVGGEPVEVEAVGVAEVADPAEGGGDGGQDYDD